MGRTARNYPKGRLKFRDRRQGHPLPEAGRTAAVSREVTFPDFTGSSAI